MTTVTPDPGSVTGGVDTHLDNHVAAAVNHLGGVLGTKSFPTTAAGYRRLLGWLGSFGQVHAVGVEGTGSYGSALTRHLAENEVRVIEVSRPNRQVRRRHGKTDVIDAVAAARAVLSGEATATPKAHNGPVEALRLLRIVQRSATRSAPRRATSCARSSPPRRTSCARDCALSRRRNSSRPALRCGSAPRTTAWPR
jgi:transposase